MNFSLLDLLLLVIVLALLLLFFKNRRDLRQEIRSISDTLDAYSRGELDKRLTVREDDLGELAFYFNKLADQLAQNLRKRYDEKEEREKVLSQLPQGVLILNDQGLVTLLNPAAHEMLSITENEYLNKPLVSLIRSAPLLDAVKGKKEGEEVELGEKTLLLHTIAPKGLHETAVYVLQDITRYKQLEKMRRDFVSNVSHELRTPLAAIRSLLEALEQGAMEDKDLREDFLQSAIKEVQRLDRLVKELLDLARIEEEKGKIAKSRVYLRFLVEEVLHSLEPLAKKAGLALEDKVPEEYFLEADGDQLTQVFINLVENSIKYTPSGGRITIGAREVLPGQVEEAAPLYGSPLLEIRVEDTGAGIPREHLSRIFERFYRVDSARSRALGGTGLGLSIVKHIVEGHGGTIRMESEIGRGTTVIITLPGNS